MASDVRRRPEHNRWLTLMNAVPTARQTMNAHGLSARIAVYCASRWDINAVWQLHHDARAAMTAGDGDSLDALRGIEVIGHSIEDAQSAATLWMSGIDFIQGNLVRSASASLEFGFDQSAL